MKGVRLKVWGEYALFTRPENKAERMSYDVPTPSAARGILEAIHWKPAIRWVVDRIHVLNPITFDSIRRNEVSDKGPSLKKINESLQSGESLSLIIEKKRQQRASLVLRHVAYVIEAHFELTDRAGDLDNDGKHIDIFRRRARNGECFQQPCLGCREFPAYFSLLEDEEMPVSALADDAPRDLGLMLYDIDFVHNKMPMFYRPKLENGIIDVARWKEETLCRLI
ncbi:MAG: type I-C CRISPR-associated protein Cas5 [Mailhella sp.]|nr:type I-C CRISPR-associated protein Cas5 [Mailhella sp.]